MDEETCENLYKWYKNNLSNIPDIKNKKLTFSKVLNQCVKVAILSQTLYTSYRRSISPKETLSQVTDKISHSQRKRKSVRLEQKAIQFLMDYYGTSDMTLALHCCIYDVLHHTAKEQLQLNYRNKIFYMIGQKNPAMLCFLNEAFEDIRNACPITGYIEPFCGTANVLLHTSKSTIENVNDNSKDLVNVLRVIKLYPYELRLSLLSTSFTQECFENFKEQLQKDFSLKSPKEKQIERATAFFFCRYTSCYGDGKNFAKKRSLKRFRQKLDIFYLISQRLENVEIRKSDAIYYLRTLKTLKGYLIYFDAPYLCSEEYYAKNNSKKSVFNSHIALRNQVEDLRNNNICLLSYRITASKTMNSKGITDAQIRNKLDRLYLNREYHFRLKEINREKGQIEILLSTVPFCGSIPYTSPLDELEVTKYV